jgi:hypothetical protein
MFHAGSCVDFCFRLFEARLHCPQQAGRQLEK